MKRKPTKWKTVIASCTSDKELISELHKRTKSLHVATLKIWALEQNRKFPKDYVKVDNVTPQDWGVPFFFSRLLIFPCLFILPHFAKISISPLTVETTKILPVLIWNSHKSPPRNLAKDKQEYNCSCQSAEVSEWASNQESPGSDNSNSFQQQLP